MRILLIHNFYTQPGGEDVVFRMESRLLSDHGHEVLEYTEHNKDVFRMNIFSAAIRMIWSAWSKARLLKIIKDFKPDVAHFHNTFFMISPSAYYACKKMNVPVVQTLHNYRVICPGALFFRNGRVCEDCAGHALPLSAILHGCWHSRPKTLVVTCMLAFHRLLRTWHRTVDIYIALTEFGRSKLIECGLPEDKIAVKPNFVYPDPGKGEGAGQYALFVGRLSPEKGIFTLLETCKKMKNIPVKIIGDGPVFNEAKELIRAENISNAELLGARKREEVFLLMKGARFVVCPSLWYETFGMVIVEAFACGVGVIASRIGAIKDIVDDGRTGLLFEPRDAADLAEKMKHLWDHPEEASKMGDAARQEYESKYSAQMNYQMLMDIYNKVMEKRRSV